MFSAHSWPRWGNARIQEVMRTQRDAYAHLNNEVLHLANQGVTINEVHNVYRLPKSLQQNWAARSYHGSEEHNSRGVINRYLGYWDANPATLIPLSPKDSAPLYVEMMGGSAKILAKGRELYKQGKYRHAQEILNKLVYAEPGNQAARDLLADVFEQIGYQKESSSLRNSFLAGAQELRSGIPSGVSPRTGGPDIVRGMTTGLLLDYLAVRLESRKAEGISYKVNLVTPDNGERYAIELNNSALTSIRDFQIPNPDLTVTVNRSDIEKMLLGAASVEQLAATGKVRLEGDARPLEQLKGMFVEFDIGFEILPGTMPAKAAAQAKAE
jgi:alkyl sulfatase BDS1-like metallo-beta-lactamase superfamily hydrolase